MDKKWNLQDIKPAQPKKRRPAVDQNKLKRTPVNREVSDDNDGTVRIGVVDGKKKRRSKLVLALLVFLAVIGIGAGVNLLMGGAEITVFPRHREPNVNASFTAYRQSQVGELAYEIMSLEAEGERQVSASGQETVSTQATGVITIYNNTDSTERLIKNTRFESPAGLVFRISESAVVPSAQVSSSGERVPGTIQAEVFADGTGEQYNISPSRLTVPGYQEGGFTDLFENIYAENTAVFTGGFEGNQFIIDDSVLETEKQRLQTELRNSLLERVPSERPAGFVVFDAAVTLTFTSLPAVEYGENLATIRERATLQIPIFEESKFAEYIAAATIPGYEEEPVRIADIDSLTFSYTSPTTTSADLGAMQSINFDLTGRPHIIWAYDEGKLKTDLMGKEKTALPIVLSGYPAIERAEAVVRPFWKQSFPDTLDDILITEVVDSDGE